MHYSFNSKLIKDKPQQSKHMLEGKMPLGGDEDKLNIALWTKVVRSLHPLTPVYNGTISNVAALCNVHTTSFS